MSPQKLTGLVQSCNHFARLKLDEGLWLPDGGEPKPISLDEIWAGLNFLKALGFHEVAFRTPSPEQLHRWIERLENYQQFYIQDPEYAGFDDFIWNELSPEFDEPVVECVRYAITADAPGTIQEVIHLNLGPVPPLLSNIAVDQKALSAFLNEIESRQPEDVFHRFESIFEEYRSLLDSEPPKESLQLLGAVFTLALENRKLDAALAFVRNHAHEFKNLFEDETWLIRALEIFEPKANEIQTWAPLFDSVKNEQIIAMAEKHLGSKAGHQLVKLISVRVAREPEHLIQFCLRSPHNIQKLLTQWLAPYWRPKHYPGIAQQLEQALQTRDPSLIQTWLQALLRSYPAQSLEDLKKYFKKLSFWESLGRKKVESLEKQGLILSALQENRSTELLKFLKEIRPELKGKSADQVEKIIGSFRDKRAS